ncbi:MAG TPA: hypothetical protein VL947_08435, partial [Cytophagales bacterium]|nr:hypothetical protein [Cytophagales bacterium]
PNNLQNKTEYTLKIAKVPTTAQKDSILNNDGSEQGYINPNKGHIVLEYKFTSSEFSNFAEKMANYNVVATENTNAPILSQSFKPSDNQSISKQIEPFVDYEYSQTQSTANTLLPPWVKVSSYDLAGKQYAVNDLKDFPVYFSGKSLVVDCKLIANKNTSNTQQTASLLAGGANAPALPASFETLNYKLGYYLPGRNNPNSFVNYTMSVK